MRLHFLGVRGSTPVMGPEFVRHGGHTSCVAIESDDGLIRLVIDAGTGLSRLRGLLHGQAFRGVLLLGHLHWDHTQGLPFCPAMDHPDARVEVHGPGHDGRGLLDRFAQAMSPPNFPIDPTSLRGEWSWHTIGAPTFTAAGFDVVAREIPHKGGTTFGYRISNGSRSIAYLSDHMPQALGTGPSGWGALHEAATSLAEGVDVLIHDAQYDADELPTRGSFGHAAAEYALELGEACRVGRVVLFHHDPARTDDEIDRRLARLRNTARVPVSAAREGDVVTVEPELACSANATDTS